MKLTTWFIVPVFLLLGCSKTPKGDAPQPPFLASESQNTTPTYEEGIAFWQEMAEYYDEISIHAYGMTDAGEPLHLVVVDGERPKPIGSYKTSLKQTLLINNAIHPGEPDGVDASMLLVHELMTEPRSKALLKNTSIVIIPFYNIGGSLNRNSHSRANQNGPEEYGFRGNAQNLDLNRDFTKCDSRNALTFATLVNELDPDFYIETHVSNGADYPYVMTYLSTQEDKIGGSITNKLRNEWTPFMVKTMSKAGFNMCPYVNVHGESPENGYATFYDQPRYSTGYLALKGIPGYITETHMLKPYKQRVLATQEFLRAGLTLLAKHKVREEVERTRSAFRNQTEMPLDWELDSSAVRAMIFDGYQAAYKPSEVTGEPRLYYDRNQPYSTKIPYFYGMKPTHMIRPPRYYILKRGFREVESVLRANGVELETFGKDTQLQMEVYTIDTFSTVTQPYEKHYYHYNTRVKKSIKTVHIAKGDWLIKLDNKHRRFLVEVLEPEAPDSYFNWNFFDAILQQKEWYSAYVFEDEAAELLKTNDDLRNKFEEKKRTEPWFEASARAQLYWVYQHSNRYEKAHLRYPVYRAN
ncbi:MAG: hypothetical protein JJ975_06980 [Bacteroidia bacterium]|nr:hypothetical protein [Bacteroidia bacterium]